MSDTESMAGTANEFLQMLNDPQPDDAPEASDDFIEPSDPTPTTSASDAEATDSSATATDDDAPESRDDGLTAAERVAAVFGLETDEDEPDAGDEQAAAADGEDLSGKSREELLAMAEGYLKLKEETATRDVDAEQQQLQAEVDALDDQTRETMRQRFEAEVEVKSDEHYGALVTQAEARLLTELHADGLRGEELEAAFTQQVDARRRPILRAQRQYEIKKAAEWEPYINDAIVAARKQSPKVRQRFAEFLCEFKVDGSRRETPLPKRAAEELIKITNTDDIPVFAQSLEDAIKVRNKDQRAASQQRRSEKAKEVQKQNVTTPPAGKPRSQKPPELKGTAEEWAAMNSMDGSTFSRRS